MTVILYARCQAGAGQLPGFESPHEELADRLSNPGFLDAVKDPAAPARRGEMQGSRYVAGFRT
jgi:hypothetical protein